MQSQSRDQKLSKQNKEDILIAAGEYAPKERHPYHKGTPVLDYVVRDFPRVANGLLCVAHDGRVYQQFTDGWVLVKQYKTGRGGRYNCVSITIAGKQRHYLVHPLIAQAYIPNPNNKPEVNHKDGNGLNNHVDNLEWATI